MKKLISYFLILAIVFSSFSSWLAIHDYVRLPMLFLGCALFLTFLYRPTQLFVFPKNTKKERYILFFFMTIVVASFTFNMYDNQTPKTLSNGIATIIILVVFYYFFMVLCDRFLTPKIIISSLAYGGLLLMTVIAIDEVLVNFFGFQLTPIMRVGRTVEEAHTYFYWGGWISTSAPTEEPGYSAMSLNILVPFSILWFKRYRNIIIIAYVSLLLALCSTQGIFSAILCFFVTIITSGLPIKKKFKIFGLLVLSTIIIELLIGFDKIILFLNQMTFFDKITMSGNTHSDEGRSMAWTQAIKDGNASPLLGQGPGYGKYIIGGYLSTFLGFYAMYGIIAAGFFVWFWLKHYLKCFKLHISVRPYFVYAFTSTFVIGMVIDQLHMFIFWLLLPCVIVLYNNRTVDFSN